MQAEDLFYNALQRRKSFKSPADEYNRVLDVVTKYAVHNPKVAFVCKKVSASDEESDRSSTAFQRRYFQLIPSLNQVGTNQAEVNTPSDTSSRANIALLYGNILGKELLQVGPSVHKSLGIEKVRGWATNANWSQKRSTFLLFINRKSMSFARPESPVLMAALTWPIDRLVDSSKMRKALESLYTAYLPKGAYPFIYIRYV